MPATITVEDLIRRHGDDLAYVAERPLASDLATFTAHLSTASNYLGTAAGHEQLSAAYDLLLEAEFETDAKTRLLRRVDKLLTSCLEDMTQEYREMVGD